MKDMLEWLMVSTWDSQDNIDHCIIMDKDCKNGSRIGHVHAHAHDQTSCLFTGYISQLQKLSPSLLAHTVFMHHFNIDVITLMP